MNYGITMLRAKKPLCHVQCNKPAGTPAASIPNATTIPPGSTVRGALPLGVRLGEDVVIFVADAGALGALVGPANLGRADRILITTDDGHEYLFTARAA